MRIFTIQNAVAYISMDTNAICSKTELIGSAAGSLYLVSNKFMVIYCTLVYISIDAYTRYCETADWFYRGKKYLTLKQTGMH